MHIFLYGASGSGKSTLGAALAHALNLDFLDLDAQIEINLNDSIANTIAIQGEEVFRDAETAALKSAITPPPSLPQDGGGTSSPPALGGVRGGAGQIIALGGGALLRAKNRALAEKAGKIIFLEADVETLAERLSQDKNKRPLLAGELKEKLATLLEGRKEHYASFPLRINAAGEKSQILWEIQRKLGRFHSRSMGTGYDILIQEGGIDKIGERLKERKLRGPILLVSDSNVAPIYANRVLKSLKSAGYAAQQSVIPAGESHKTLESVSQLWRDTLNAGLDRKSTIVSLGGGMTSDLAGFVAATFMRGCNWVALPTSLLAMVDASMGGKTGFDLPEGKNLVGAFHPPRLVLADPATLATLPARELRSGMAEVLKHGVIADRKLFVLCKKLDLEDPKGFKHATAKSDSMPPKSSVEKDMQIKPFGSSITLSEIVRRGMAVKVKIIEEDPYEQGIRAALNLGHTIGHAVELLSGFEILHGEAVGIGMVTEAKIAEQMGIAELGLATVIANALVALGLPTEIPQHLPLPDIIHTMQTDKKKSAGIIRFALPVRIGEVKVGVGIENLKSLLE
ncbi:MAG: 3-dehydroquinate synthase [Anaerolineae bacterium]|jgi:shikimate kinase / 3-dehydroquinate synthase|nr:3-dehydroquinate synthase [Anaerolineae bacterium]